MESLCAAVELYSQCCKYPKIWSRSKVKDIELKYYFGNSESHPYK